jgi:hypothetical protein
MTFSKASTEVRLVGGVLNAFGDDLPFDPELFDAVLRAVFNRASLVLGDETAVYILRRVVIDARAAKPLLATCGLAVEERGFRFDAVRAGAEADALGGATGYLIEELLATIGVAFGLPLRTAIVSELESIARVSRVLALRTRLRGTG